MGLRRRIFGGVRTRILAGFVVLMAFSTVVSVIAIYEVLVVRADDRLDAALQQEVEEFRRLASGINPATGEAVRGTTWRRSSGSSSSATSPARVRRS